MRGKIFLIILTFFILHTAFAYEDLGKLKTALKKYPLIFKPHHVQKIEIKGVSGFTFTGESEQFFDGDMSEPESELYREATRDAYNFLFIYFTKGDSKKAVQMSGAQLLYQYAEGVKRRVVYFVPANKIKIKAKSTIKHAPVKSVPLPDVDKLLSSPSFTVKNLAPTNHSETVHTNKIQKTPANPFSPNDPFFFF